MLYEVITLDLAQNAAQVLDQARQITPAKWPLTTAPGNLLHRRRQRAIFQLPPAALKTQVIDLLPAFRQAGQETSYNFV